MAKKGMNLRYKSKKRERNKNKKEDENPVKSFVVTLSYVLVFLLGAYLIILGLQKLGLFLEGYTEPNREETVIDYEFINANTVFNRDEKEYYVLFDNYDSDYTKDAYVNDLVDALKTRVYNVDMSKKINSIYKADKANKKASKVEELAINDTTLIKIKSGRIVDYLVGSEDIEKYLGK